MEPIKKILACIDFSDYSYMTLDYAVTLAKLTQAQIVVLNVVNQRDITGVQTLAPYFPSNIVVDEYVDDMKNHRLDQMKQMIRDNFFQDKSMMIMKIDTGVPYECILKVIKTEDIDLVIMGNKGRATLQDSFSAVQLKKFSGTPLYRY